MERSPVAELAEELGIETLKPVRPNEGWFLDKLRDIAPDCCPVTAYGALLPQAALDIPAHGWVNLHFSVLPAWRGAAPVQHAILRGDDITGREHLPDRAGTRRGPRLRHAHRADRRRGHQRRPARQARRLRGASCSSTPWTPSRTARSARCRSRPTGSASRPSSPRPTPASTGSCPPHLIDRQIRALHPRPRGVDRIRRRPAQALAGHACAARRWPCRPAPGAPPACRGGHRRPDLAPGELRVDRNAVYAGTGTIPVRLGDVQPPGKRRMPAADWARGIHAAGTTPLGPPSMGGLRGISPGGTTPPGTPPSMGGLRPPVTPHGRTAQKARRPPRCGCGYRSVVRSAGSA